MKVVVLYRPKSEFARSVEEFVQNVERTGGPAKINLVDVDTRDGSATASLYDVLEYPAVLALSDDGQVVQEWKGSMLPLASEVSYYAHT